MNDDLAEQSVLSCCYQSPLALERASAILTAADFANLAHQKLWGVLRDLKAEGKRTDAMSVQLALNGNKHLMGVHLTVAMNPAVPDAVDQYASTVHGFARRRELVAAAIRLRQRAEDLEADPQALASEAVNTLTRVRDLGAPDIETQTLGELMHKPDDPYDWVIPQLLERMDRLVITGEEGLGKACSCGSSRSWAPQGSTRSPGSRWSRSGRTSSTSRTRSGT
jgi:replicative DNA helicase